MKMEINRNNYQEYFLLYLDDELSVHQKNMVDEFLLIHKDLKVEFNLFKQTKLPNPTLISANKSTLYRFDIDTIHKANYEENFLLYADNELDENKRQAVEKFVLQNPSYQNEFTVLKMATLQPENIQCPFKNELLKKERKPIIYFGFKPVAIAASLVLIAVAVWLLNFKNTIINNNNIAFNSQTNNSQNNNTSSINNLQAKPSIPTISNNKVQPSTLYNQQEEPKVQSTSNTNLATTIINQNNEVNNAVTNSTVSTIHNTIKQEKNIVEVDLKSVYQNANYKTLQTSNNTALNTLIQVNNNIEETNMVQQSTFQYIDINEITENESSNEKLINIGNIKVKKSKLKNIFKKAKKIIGAPIDNKAIALATL